jgi:hypothetical protein
MNGMAIFVSCIFGLLYIMRSFGFLAIASVRTGLPFICRLAKPVLFSVEPRLA